MTIIKLKLETKAKQIQQGSNTRKGKRKTKEDERTA